jgi:hypothetical protein
VKTLASVGGIREVLTTSSRKPQSSIPRKKKTIQPGDAFEDTTIKPGFEIAKF